MTKLLCSCQFLVVWSRFRESQKPFMPTIHIVFIQFYLLERTLFHHTYSSVYCRMCMFISFLFSVYHSYSFGCFQLKSVSTLEVLNTYNFFPFRWMDLPNPKSMLVLCLAASSHAEKTMVLLRPRRIIQECIF